MAELSAIGITAVGLELIERIDSERATLAEAIADAEARITEWTATASTDAVLDFYNRIVDVVQGRVAQADGVAEINAVLHDTLLGVRLGYDGRTLTADITVRPSGLDEYDAAVAELFGTLGPWREAIEMLERLLPDEATISIPRTYLQGIDSAEIIDTCTLAERPWCPSVARCGRDLASGRRPTQQRGMLRRLALGCRFRGGAGVSVRASDRRRERQSDCGGGRASQPL